LINIRQLKKTLKKTLRQCSLSKRKLRQKNLKKILQRVFIEDQTNFIKYGTQRGASWSANTINKALKLYVACG